MTTMRPQVNSLEPTSPTPPSVRTTPAPSRRERRRQRFLACRLSRLSLEDDDPIERQVLQLLRQARSVHTPASCSPTLPYLIHLLILMLSLASSAQSSSSHQPFNWTLQTFPEKRILAYNVTSVAPSFLTHVCPLAGISFRPECQVSNIRKAKVGHHSSSSCRGGNTACLLSRNNRLLGPQFNPVSGFYICPASARGCHDPSHFYCPSWGCVTMAHGWSGTPNRDPYLSLQVANNSRWDFISLTVKNPNDDTWLAARPYGLRLYMSNYDRGALFEIQKRVVSTPPSAIGPNHILNPPPSPTVHLLPSSSTPLKISSTWAAVVPSTSPTSPPPPPPLQVYNHILSSPLVPTSNS
nr:endogenous retrovirus group S71 member 1 Env polyprotein-like [Dasypus novemcinctus]